MSQAYTGTFKRIYEYIIVPILSEVSLIQHIKLRETLGLYVNKFKVLGEGINRAELNSQTRQSA